MQTRRTLAAVGLAGAMALTTALTPVLAAETRTAPAAQAATPAVPVSQIITTSQDAAEVLQNVRAARVALFEGSPDAANAFVAAVVESVKAARNAAADVAIEASDANARYVPFDVSMALAEGFQPTEEKVAELQKAHAHMTRGDQKEAAAVLNGADIAVTVSAAMMPVDAAATHAAEAASLMAAGKYYEANLALKSIEDGVVVESYALSALPAQGNAG